MDIPILKKIDQVGVGGVYRDQAGSSIGIWKKSGSGSSPTVSRPKPTISEADINALSELLYFVKDLADSPAEGGKVGGRQGEEE